MAVFETRTEDDSKIILYNKDGSKALATIYAYQKVSKEGMIESLQAKGLNVKLETVEAVDKPEL